MTDERKPPLRPRKDPELVRVNEDEPGQETDRVPLPMPPPQRLDVVRRPKLGVLQGRQPSYVEIAAQLGELRETTNHVLAFQRKMAVQLNGHGVTINTRFDLFHEELALLRATVTGDHAPRLETVEKTIGQKAARGGGILAIVVVALPMLADVLPKYRHLIDTIVGALQ